MSSRWLRNRALVSPTALATEGPEAPWGLKHYQQEVGTPSAITPHVAEGWVASSITLTFAADRPAMAIRATIAGIFDLASISPCFLEIPRWPNSSPQSLSEFLTQPV